MGRVVHPHIITPDSALGGMDIRRSVRCGNSGGFTRTPSVTGNQKVWTWSGWTKRWATGGSHTLFSSEGNNDGIAAIYFHTSDTIHTYFDTSGSNPYGAVNSRLYRDPHSWMHVVWQVDALNSDQRIWINGQEESVTGSNDPPNYAYSMNQAGKVNGLGISAYGGGQGQLYLAEVHHSDGYKYDPSYYGYTDPQTGIWRPKKVTGISYGTNGFYLDFSDNSAATAAALGKDRSGNGNDWTPNGSISVANDSTNDSLLDTPTNNFCTLSPLGGRGTYFMAPDHGGLNFSLSAHTDVMSSFVIPDSGKWYAEFVFTTTASGAVGVCNLDKKNDGTAASSALNGINYNGSDIKVNDSSVQSSLTAIGDNDVIGVQVDRDAGTVQFTNDGSNVGTPVNISLMNAPFDIMFNLYRNSSGGSTPVGYANFGQRPFSYLPSGFRSLCDKNMTTPTASSIVDPKKHFEVLTYTGNDATGRVITGLDFQPDFVWIKNTTQGFSHALLDSVRGGTKRLRSDSDAVEGTDADSVTSFNANGWTMSGNDAVNQNSQSFVAWCWKAGGTAVSNTDGDVTSQVSVNEEAGFSIVSFTTPAGSGFSIGHGLSKAPETIWMKNRDNANNWDIYHHENGTNPEQYRLIFNSTSARQDYPYLDDTVPSSTVFRTRGGGNWYNTGNKIIAYCFYSVPGFSKMGSYKGTGNANGPFVYTGFRPSMIIIKRIDTTEDWWIHDDQRNPHNPIDDNLYPNGSEATATEVASDFLSNGFKLRTSNQNWNDDGDTYVYWAWAGQVGNTPYMAPTNAR